MTSGDQPGSAQAEAGDQALPGFAAHATDEIRVLLAEFSHRAGALGVVVERLAGSDDAAGAIEALVADAGAGRIVISNELQRAAPALIAALSTSGVEWATPGDAAALQHEQLGASLGQLAIAETGSVLLSENNLADRAIGMLVAVQIIVCRTASLAPSLDDAASVLRDLALLPRGGYTTLVTGPSRTADIERVLTVGVQGPGRVVALFVDTLT